MRFRWSYAMVLAALLACKSVRPDTITMKDSISINGSLLGMSDGLIRIKARFPSEKKEMWIPVKDAQSIEFNSLTFNSGPPPKIVGFGPPQGQDASKKGTHPQDVIVLRGGTRRPCNLVGIDANGVHCDPNGAVYARDATLRVVLGSE